MRIVITGGSGFLGRKLALKLTAAGDELVLLGRAPKKGLPPNARFTTWDPERGAAPVAALDGAEAVVHLAGEPVAQRWTGDAKRRIRTSRVVGTANLVQGLEQAKEKPKVLVCASAIGYYGERGDEKLTEASRPGGGFLPDVCQEWESAALEAKKLGVRVVLLRTGVVLGDDGGALARMLLPFKLGIGGRIGSGEQWMSWIHADDAVGLMEMALRNEAMSGPVNVTAPEPVTNAEFTAVLAKVLHRPAILPIPVAALRLLYGEMSEVVTASQRVLPEAARKAGYVFRYAKLEPALREILGEQKALAK